MEGGRGQHWQDVATENRVRIQNLEREAERQRTRTHELAEKIGTVQLLAERISTLTEELRELGEKFERLSRRAMERPTSGGVSAVAAWASVVVAVIALAVAATR